MTLEELYAKIGGNYDHARQILRMDKLIDRHIRRLKISSIGDQLTRAEKTMDPTQLFESAHAMKGVCANLGLDELAAAAEKITEEFRPGSSRKLSDEEVKALVAYTLDKYRYTLETIEEYERGN